MEAAPAPRRTAPDPLRLLDASQECTLDDHRARTELGYAPVTSREQGMRELRDAVA